MMEESKYLTMLHCPTSGHEWPKTSLARALSKDKVVRSMQSLGPKLSFPGPVLPGSAEEARLLGERDPNLDDKHGDIPEVRPTDMWYARGSRESDEEDVPAASEDEDDPAYDPKSGEESGNEAGGGRPVANSAGRAPRNPPSSGGVASQGASNRLAIVAHKSREYPAGAWLQYIYPNGLLLEWESLLLWGLTCGARWFNT
jgi:hypothetical protein